jgi:TolB-like protein
MIQQYLPKIKAQTAKNMAKNLLSTQKGKKISDTKFKQFLKQDKDLKKFVHSSKSSTIAKHQAKKFFSTVTESAKQSGNLKVNPTAAKKMGIRINKQGQISNIGINKIYQKATTEELAIENKPTGPTPAESRKEKRHEEAIKKLHQREQAGDIAKEQKQGQKQQPAKDEKKSSSPPPRSSGASGTGTSLSNQSVPLSSQGSPTQRKTAKIDTSLPAILVSSLNNLSTNVRGLDWTARRINNLIIQTLKSLKMFKIIEEEEISEVLTKLKLEKLPASANEAVIKQIARETRAVLFVIGYIKKINKTLEIKIQIINTATDQHLDLATIKEESDDIFQLERKIKWQINNALLSDAKTENKDVPSSDEAVDLPI